MAEPPETIFEEREELMISPTGDGKPVLRTAHFLKPTVTSIDGPVLKLRAHSPFSAYSTHFEVGEWPLNVHFNGWRCPQKLWKSWVGRLRPAYESTWKQAGIHEAILNSTYDIRKNDDLVLAIAEKWCNKTKSFIFPWGEATITLEDMMALGGYSVLGDSVLSHLGTEEMVGVEARLIEARKEAGRSASKSADQHIWMKQCYECGSDFEHEAFLALWLSRFVFPDGSRLIRKCVFPIAILLARGIRIALAPAVLASIYRDLRLLKETIVASTKLDLDDEHDEVLELNLRAPFQLVQIWVWERFVELRQKPKLIELGEPRWARWDKMQKLRSNDLRLALDSAGDCFHWRPYVTALNSGGEHNFYSNEEKPMLVDSVLDGKLQSFARCIRVSELVGLDCIEQYLPHRVAMQFGFDQDIPGCVGRCNESSEIAWSNYNRPISDVKLYIPFKLFESDVTVGYLEWWKKSFDREDAIKGVVRKRRSPRSSKTLNRSLQSSKRMRGGMASYVPPGFLCDRNRMEARISSNKYDISTGIKQEDENQPHLLVTDSQFVEFKYVPPPPGFPPKIKRVKVENSCYEHNDFQGLVESVPPGFPPKFNGVDGMVSSTRCSSLENRQDGASQHLQMADPQRLWSQVVVIKNVPPPPGFPPKFSSVEAAKSSCEHCGFQEILASVPLRFPPKCNGVEGMISSTRCSSLETKRASGVEKLQDTQSQNLSLPTAENNIPSVWPDLSPKCNGKMHDSIGAKLDNGSKPSMSAQSQCLCDEAASKMESLINPVENVIIHREAVIRRSEEDVEDGNASGADISAQNAARTYNSVGKRSNYFTLDVTVFELEARIGKLEKEFAALKSEKLSNRFE